MRCPNCGAQVPDGEKFCPQCGVPVDAVQRCPHCGAAVLPGEQFCGECGRPIEVAVPPTPPTVSAPPTPSKKGFPWLWVAIGVGIVVVLGCLGVCVVLTVIPKPTPPPVPTRKLLVTNTPTLPPRRATPSPKATVVTPPPDVVEPFKGKLLYEEDFTSPGDEWAIETGDAAEYKLEHGAYSIEVRKQKWMAWNKIGKEFDDFVLEFDVRLAAGGDPDNSAGAFFRYQDNDNFYSLDINGNGSYTIGKEVDNDWSAIVSWTNHPAINKAGKFNHVKLIMSGDLIMLYVNGQFIDSVTDDSFDKGDIAMEVTAYENPPSRALFDNVKIWEVK